MSSATTANPAQAFPQLAPGVSLSDLRRVWFATPADRRHQRATLLESIVVVKRSGHAEARPLVELSRDDVDRVLGSAPRVRYRVEFYQQGRRGIQVATFVEHQDAETFAAEKRCYGKPAQVRMIGGGR